MSHAAAASASSIPAEQPRLAKAGPFLIGGLILIAITLLGAFVGDSRRLALSWLVAVGFWTAISLGSLVLVMLHHIFDAGWSTVIRRTLEHWLATFPILAMLFVPLLIASIFVEPGVVWEWMDKVKVGGDLLWTKKSAFLNPVTFTIFTTLFFTIWIVFSNRLRKHSFAQDDDGLPEHTSSNRRWSAAGIPLTGMSLTFAAFYWFMSLQYHWFSTMYGVWFFASCMRAALAFVTILCIYLTARGVLRGIFSTAHLLNLGNIMLAFTVFWAYICFSQYFLIWNANVPEETFWYNVRDINLSTGLHNSWWWVGLVLLFGHFFVPFFFFLGHGNKLKSNRMVFICVWILVIELLDICFNVMPAISLPNGDTAPFAVTLWDFTAVFGVGALCVWAFLNSFVRTRCIPIRDPRIVESLKLHE